MSKVFNTLIKKAKDQRSKSRSRRRGGSDTIKDEQSDVSPMDDSPRSVAGSSIEDFDRPQRSQKSMDSSYDRDPISPPVGTNRDLQESARSLFDTYESVKGSNRELRAEFDLAEEPNDRDYDDFGFENSNNSDHIYEFSNHSNKSERDIVEMAPSRRAKSAGRTTQYRDNGIDMLEPKVAEVKKSRSKSTGRFDRKEQPNDSYLNGDERRVNSTSNDEVKRKSKMEKILQLQEKNQRYKDEFRKVQKDRKALKKEVENKKLETASLSKEIDAHIAEATMLKQKLSETLKQLDQTDIEERKGRNEIVKLQKELSSVRGDYNAALGRIARMREEIEAMKIDMTEHEERTKSLSAEVAEQASLIESLHMENVSLKNNSRGSNEDDTEELRQDNDRLRKELGDTLERASTMVKEREDAIADLLRENEEVKRLVASHEEENAENQLADEIMQLRNELSAANAALEETQDRNVLLEEDIEAWIAKGEALETDIQRLRDDVDAWQKKAAAAEKSMNVVEASAQESAKRALASETAHAEAERKFKELLQEQELRHTEALLDQKEKLSQQIAIAKENNNSAPNPQELMLQKAVADRKAKEAAAKTANGWGSVMQMYRGNSTDADEELTPDQKRIKELEAASADREEEFTKVKSDLVKLRSTYNDTMYNNKKKIEQLEMENSAYAAKQLALELEISALRKQIDECVPNSASSVASF